MVKRFRLMEDELGGWQRRTTIYQGSSSLSRRGSQANLYD